MLSLLTKALPAVKAAGRLVGAVGKHSDGSPVVGRKRRLVASLVALAAAYGYLNPEQAEAVLEVVLSVLAFV